VLRSLIYPLAEDVFLRRYFPQRLLVSHGPLRRFSRLLALDELKDAESAARACRSYVRVWSRGVDVHVDGVEAMDCYRAGMTLYMTGIGRCIPAVQRFVRDVATDLGIPAEQCGADLIASRAGAGAPMHFDSDDGFNIQLRGRKRWRTAPNRWVAHPLVSYGVGYPDIGRQLSANANGPMPERMPASSRTHHVRPGSVVYLPRGTWHETQVVGREDSLALVVNLSVPSWADLVLDALRRRLVSRARFRETAYAMGASGTRVKALLDEAAREIGSITPPEIFSDPSPYLFALFSPNGSDRCTLTSPGKARHVLRVHHARRGSTELILEDRALARLLQHVLTQPGGVHGTALLERFGGDSQDLAGALRMLVAKKLLRRSTDPPAPVGATTSPT
jgi:50S ribosomal protein L16 3-hydroxylase